MDSTISGWLTANAGSPSATEAGRAVREMRKYPVSWNKVDGTTSTPREASSSANLKSSGIGDRA